jgi:RHS repeat-associated protein
VVWSGGSNINTYNGAVINNHGTWDAQADAYFYRQDASRGSFNNYGTVSRTTGSGTASFEQISFNNLGGAINVASSTLVVGAGTSTGGSFNASAGATLAFQSYYGGTQTLTGIYTGSGAGSVILTGNPYSGYAPLTLAIGVAGATFDLAPGLFQMSYGIMAGPGTLTNVGALTISGNYTGSHESMDGLTLANQGTVVWSGGIIDTYNAPVINNQGTWDAQADAYFYRQDANRGSFNNYGTVTRTTGTGTAAFEQIWFNNLGGAINVASTTLVVGAGTSTGGSFTAAADSTLSFQSYYGGTQTLTGTYTGSGAGIVELTGNPYSGYALLTLAIGAAGATFDFAPGLLLWTRDPISGPGTLTNAGSLTLIGSGTRYLDPGALVNSGTLHVSGMTLDIGSPGATAGVENTGSLGTSGGGVIDLKCPLSVDGSGILAGQASGTVIARSNLTGNTQNAHQYAPFTAVQLAGSGTQAAPQLIEVMSQDQGATGAGFGNNFVYDQLVVGNNTHVRLVDQSHNAAAAGVESLYVNTLVVKSGATLDLNGLHVYARDTQVGGTVIGGVVTTLPPGGPIVPNTPTPGNIAVAGQIDDWTFFGRGGQSISVVGNPGNGSPAPLAPNLDYAEVSVIDPSGNVVASGSSANSGVVVSLLGVALTADGTYHVHVQASAGQAGATGHYVLSVNDAPVNVRALVLGQQVVGQIATAYSVDRWTFSALANTSVQFQWLNAAGPLQFKLSGPGGWTGFSALTGSSDPVTLPTTGTYTLDASSAGEQGGVYAFQLAQLTQTKLTLGTPYSGTLVGSGQSQLFQVTLPATEQLLVTLKDNAPADQNEVYVSYGAPPTRANYQYRFATPAAANQQVLVPTATAGTWYILVYDNLVPAPGSYTLAASAGSVFLTGVTPASQGTASNATLILSGLGFTPAPAISLVAAGGTVYPAASVVADSATQVVATFTAGSVPAGIYTVRVTAADGSTANLPNAFTLVAGGKAVLTTNIIVPNPIGYHIASTIYVDYSNTGTVPMPAPILEVTGVMNGQQGALLTLNAALQTEGFWTSSTPAGFSQSVQFLASGAQPGILQPGESEQVPVYYAGWLQNQWDFSRPPITFTVGVLGADDTQTVDWTSLQSNLQPASITTPAWNALFPNLNAQLGTTWGAYVQRLDADAQYLAGLGASVTDISQLFSFEIQQANGYSPLGSLAGATDAVVAAPGLPLGLGRSFAPGIIARNQFGPFGWGWSDSWHTTLTTLSDGTVVISLPDEGQRTFQPDSRPGGAYFAQPGDHGILAALPGGGYTLTETGGQITAYNSDGTLNYIQDANGNRITTGYTGGLLTSLTHSSGASLTIAYNAAGLISSITDSDGRATAYHYDAGNQYLIAVVSSDGQATAYTYDTGTYPVTARALLSVLHSDGTHDFFTYDAQGRLTDARRDAGAEDSTFAYALGQVSVTDALNDTTKYFFDNHGLLLQIQDPLQNNLQFSYDQNFNLVQTTDALGRTYKNTYDARGNLLTATDPLGHTVRFTYATIDNRPESVTDPNGNTTKYGYDGKGDLTSTAYADGTVASTAYDPIGNVLSTTDRRGQASHYTYDTAGNVLTATYADGSTVTYTYDAHANLTSASDASGLTTLTYDTSDRLVQITYASGRYLKFSYDTASRRIQMVDQTGFTVNYGYDTAGRLASLTDGTGNSIVQYAYDAVGRLSRKDNGNGTYTTYAYDAASDLLHLINFAPDGAVNSRFDCSYDSFGRCISEATADGTWTYTYDAIGELTHAVFASTSPSVANQDLTYVYDADGNRTQTISNGTTTNYTANNLNEYMQIGGTTYAYDPAGNLVSATNARGTTTYTYDARNRLAGFTGPSGSWTYLYDVFGTRVSAAGNVQRSQFVVDPFAPGSVVGTYDAGGQLLDHYVTGLGLTSMVNSSGIASYYGFDVQGNTSDLTGAAGTPLNHYVYDPFGGSLSSRESVVNPFQFVGQFGVQADSSGASFMQNRFYDSRTGRFLTTDPTGLLGGSTNLYQYAENGPTFLADPLGLAPGSLRTWEQGPPGNYVNLGASGGSGLGATAGFQFNQYGIWAYVGMGVTTPGVAVSLTTGGTMPSEGLSAQVSYTLAPSFAGPTANYSRSLDDIMPPMGEASMEVGGAVGASVGGYSAMIVYTQQLVKFGEPPPGLSNGDRWKASRQLNPYVPQGPTAPLEGGSSQNTGSHDPNAKFGPAGVGPANIVAPNAILPYRVDFENDPTATAPAQTVTVTDQLDPNLNWSTFALTQVGFGDTNITIPAGTQNYQTTADTTENGQTFQVQINLGINALTGQVFATFYSIDPATGLPPANVLTGFLPPDDGTGRGTGYFSYTVQPKAGLAVSTQIRNVAVITFDVNPPIATDQVDDNNPSKGVDTTKQDLITIGTLADRLTMQVSAVPVVGGKFTVAVSAVDAHGNTDVNFNGTAELLLSSAPPGGKLTGAATAVFHNGVATFANLSLNAAGSYTLVAASTGDLLGASTTLAVTAPPQFKVSLAAATNNASAGQPFNVTVTAQLGGKTDMAYLGTVLLTSSDPQVAPATYTFLPGDNGKKSITITLLTPGKQTVSVADIGLTSTKATSSAATVAGTLPSTIDHFTVTGIPSNDLTGTAHTLTITAVTIAGTPVVSYVGTVHIASSTDPAFKPFDVIFTKTNNGVAHASVTLTTLGVQSVTATDGNGKSGSEGNINVLSLATKLSVTASATSPVAGTPVTITVKGLTSAGRVDTQFADFLTVTTSDPHAQLVLTPLANGQQTFTVTFQTAGSQTITVSDVTRPGILGPVQTVHVLAGAATQLSVTGYPLFAIAGTTHSFAVTAQDQFGNTAAKFADAISVAGQAYTFKSGDLGKHTFTTSFPTSGAAILTATDTMHPSLVHAGTESATVVSATVALTTDPSNNADSALVIIAPPGGSTVIIAPTNTDGTAVSVKINGKAQAVPTPSSPLGVILVYGQTGSDTIDVVSAIIGGKTTLVSIPALLLGGTGAAILSVAGSSADNILVGGPLQNTLTGGTGHDILIGGGPATLNAGTGDDILIAGTIPNAKAAALLSLMSAWTATGTYQERVQALFAGPLAPANIVPAVSRSRLVGGTGTVQDWFWLAAGDILSGYASGDIVTLEPR